MVLLQAIVEIVIRPMQHVIAQGLTDRTGIGIMPIGRHPLWHTTGDGPRGAEERLGRRLVALLTQQNVDEVPIAINGPVQVGPASFHFNIRSSGPGEFHPQSLTDPYVK